MTLRFASLVSLASLLAFTAFASAQDATPAPPPIKMGLWQSSVTVNMSNMPNMPNGGSMTHVNQSCMTPDSWKDAFRNMQQRRQQASANCTAANVSRDAHQLTIDMSCSSTQGFNTNIHVQMFLDNESAMHGTAVTKMSGPNFPQGMVVNSTISSRFVSSDCGDVKPGEGRTVEQ